MNDLNDSDLENNLRENNKKKNFISKLSDPKPFSFLRNAGLKEKNNSHVFMKNNSQRNFSEIGNNSRINNFVKEYEPEINYQSKRNKYLNFKLYKIESPFLI